VAQFNLALLYEKGEGVAVDKAKAVEWYKKAAEQGHVAAQTKLSECYRDGVGVEKDLELSTHWLLMSKSSRV
jgi:hypothetical protein